VRIFGLSVTRQKAAVSPMGSESGLYSSVGARGGWWPIVREGFTGAWQRNISIRTENVLTFSAVYACVTLIASDIGKLRIKLVKPDRDGIWQEVETASPFWPVLRKPNRYQTRIQFFEYWMLSKLIHGNAYILKQRDQRGVVVALYVLDPLRTRPLVAPDGSVFYEIGTDNLSHVDAAHTVVPASEIIHDRMATLYHPLCGVSPISACGLAAVQGLRAQEHSTNFFQNGAYPGGMLVVPGSLNEENATLLRKQWEEGYSGQNYGRVAVLGNGLTYTPLNMVSAVDAQFIEQLKWTAENVCTAYKVPPYKVNVGPAPSYNNVEALDQQYYGQCLQTHFESIEILLDEGMGLDPMGTEFELDDLMRMDTPSLMKAAADGIGSGGVAPNEARSRWLNLGPVTGGETPYLQQQNYSLAALAKRDAQDDPFASRTPPPAPPSPSDDADDEDEDQPMTDDRAATAWRKALAA